MRVEFTLRDLPDPETYTRVVEAQTEEQAWDILDAMLPEEVMVINFKILE
jgi:hypothetical protein